MTGFTNASTGISGGAILVVSSPANVSVTVSKGDKSYTKNSGDLGSTTFKGLTTGTWTVVISGNGQTATRTIEITADYAITIAFFSATINITYPATSTCVVKNSSGTTVASNTNTGSSAKTWTATVNATGIYTITATATDGSGNTKSTTASITSTGQSVSVELSYWDGELFVDGNAYSDITGGFEVANWIGLNWYEADIEDESSGSYLQASYTGKSAGGLFTANKIDVTSYNTLTCVFDPESTFVNNTSAFQAYVAVSDSVGGTIKDPFASVFVTYAQTNSKTSVDLDISDLTGSYHLGFASFNARQEGMIRVTELRLLR